MAEPSAPPPRSVVRVCMPGQPAFQLRKGEEGISAFDPDAVDPPLTENEILDCFASRAPTASPPGDSARCRDDARAVQEGFASFSVSPFDFYGECPRCHARIKVRSFAAVPELEDASMRFSSG